MGIAVFAVLSIVTGLMVSALTLISMLETNLGQFFIAYMAGARFDLIWKDMGKIGSEKPDFLKSADELMEPPVHGEL